MATPMIDDLELKAVQLIRQESENSLIGHSIPGLDGTLQQRLGRKSHRVFLQGYLLPDSATDDLKKLQNKAAGKDEVTFTADITTALSIDKMMIESFRAHQQVGPPGQIGYSLWLVESPPLPPPAEVSSFGGLGDFGVGDLGFDPGALGDIASGIADQAGALADLAQQAAGAIDKLQALGNLANLGSKGNPVKPVADQIGQARQLGTVLKSIADAVKGITG
jgi:hypothetical protein